MRSRRRSRSLRRPDRGGLVRRRATGRRRSAHGRRRAGGVRPRAGARLVADRRRGRQAGGSTQLGPAVIVGVDVLEFEAAVARGTWPGRRRRAIAARSHSLSPASRDRVADAPQHDLRGDRIELEVAAGRQEREVLSTWRSRSRRLPPSSARKRRSKRNSRRWVPTKSSTVQSDLPVALAQAAAELLQEQGRALGRPQEQERVDVRHVDALVEQVDGEHDVRLARRRGRAALPGRSSGRAVAPDRDAAIPRRSELLGHEAGVLDADAEAERPHLPTDRRPCAAAARRLASPRRRRRSDVGQRVDVVALPAPPRHSREVECRRGRRSRRTARGTAGRSRPRPAARRRCGRRSSGGRRGRRRARASR